MIEERFHEGAADETFGLALEQTRGSTIDAGHRELVIERYDPGVDLVEERSQLLSILPVRVL